MMMKYFHDADRDVRGSSLERNSVRAEACTTDRCFGRRNTRTGRDFEKMMRHGARTGLAMSPVVVARRVS